MKTCLILPAIVCLIANTAPATPPALTIYNNGFAVVRDTVPLDLKSGVNEVRFTGATAQLEPDSVILRDPAENHSLQILEQNYRNDPVSQELLLSVFEGKQIEFKIAGTGDNPARLVSGKIIRSGYVPGVGTQRPIVEVGGKLQFSLPGEPLFPSLGGDTILEPTLNWVLNSDKPGKFDAEISYITDGFEWEADYNLAAPEAGDNVDLIGWITMKNHSGKTFENAKIKLMAGDVNRIRPQGLRYVTAFGGGGGGGGEPVVIEKAFDDYHLYTVARPATLHDEQTKQIEFVRGTGVHAATVYIYDGVMPYVRFSGGLNDDRSYGTQCNKKVLVARQFVNAQSNHLGMPLPKGKLRFYRRNDDGQMEFTGEDTIDHTPNNETVHVNMGNAFDLVGERKQTDFQVYFVNPPPGTPGTPAFDPATGAPIAQTTTTTTTNGPPPPWVDESFEIKVRNHKKVPADVRVVEHLYRWSNWDIKAKSDNFKKTDAQTIEFPVKVQPEEEKVITYTVHYAW
jgi:hypothetical protein